MVGVNPRVYSAPRERLFLSQSAAGGLHLLTSVQSSTVWLFTRDNIAFSIPNLSGVIIKFREDWTV